MVGIGAAHARTFVSSAQADAWWKTLVADIDHESDPALVQESMAGPVAFVSFPFTETGEYEVVVPAIVIGRRGGHAWVTVWNNTPLPDPSYAGPVAPGRLDFAPGPLDHTGWLEAVRDAVSRIQAGELEKVVIARDELAESDSPVDTRYVLARLAESYPQTWTFCVKHLVGASPELLVAQEGGNLRSRVLAGTIPGDRDPASLARVLSDSSKDLAEHEYAVASVAQALRPLVASLEVPEQPFVLELPNVMHLATDISGKAIPGSTVLSLAAAIHPSAAVCGTPTDKARALIAGLERMDRGRYAGPVGWINAAGDGELALALRCGLLEDNKVRLFAGCGIVADSDPEAEWAESIAKLEPMKQALRP